MFNLLPDSLKNEIKKEYKLRRLVVCAVFILCLQVTSLIFLFPSWIASVGKEKDLKSQVDALDSSKKDSNIATLRPFLKNINSELSLIDKSLDYPKILPVINSVISQRSRAIKLSGVDISIIGTSTANISVAGFSDSREALVNYKNKLESSGVFRSVDLPISNLAKDKDIDFNIRLVYSD